MEYEYEIEDFYISSIRDEQARKNWIKNFLSLTEKGKDALSLLFTVSLGAVMMAWLIAHALLLITGYYKV